MRNQLQNTQGESIQRKTNEGHWGKAGPNQEEDGDSETDGKRGGKQNNTAKLTSNTVRKFPEQKKAQIFKGTGSQSTWEK